MAVAQPFRYGAAVTAFFIGDDLTDEVQDSLSLMCDLERYLLDGHLQPYVREEDNATADPEVFLDFGAGRADCTVCFALRFVEGVGIMVERAAAKGDSTILLLEATKTDKKRAALIEELQEELNRK